MRISTDYNYNSINVLQQIWYIVGFNSPDGCSPGPVAINKQIKIFKTNN